MNKSINITLILAFLLLGLTTANAGVSFSINLGSGDYYQPVGDYDYLPYAYQTNPGYAAPRINFHDMMGQYGVWVNISPFGQVWKPYASNDWRPYTYGHWISTQQYGQMWEGYEPWAWAGYHYGNWIFDRNYGWVWIPGYDWHAGRVTWARSYDSIGWMPAPPYGYDYSRGYLSNVGPNNQFSYNDNDFGAEFGADNYSYGGPYYDPRYQNMYYNPSYTAININLWIFIDNSHYGYDNYANYALGPDYTRHIFDRRLVRITNHPIDRTVLERIIRQRVQETPVEVRQLQTDRQTIRVVVPTSADSLNKVRKESKEVVRQIIAPGFAEKQHAFKGQNSKNKEVVSRIFHQENVQPKVETLSSEQIINQAREASQNREQSRKKIEQAQQEKLTTIEKSGKIKEPKKEKIETKTDLKGGPPESGKDFNKQNEVQKQSDAAKQQRQHEAQLQSDAAKQKERDVQKQKDAKQKEQEVQAQNEALKQKEHEAQVRNEAAKNKQQEQQQQIDSAQKKAQEKDSVQQAQTEPTKESDKSQQDSKDKKAKSKTKHKEKPKPQQEQQPPQ